jgi:hypothetical protein
MTQPFCADIVLNKRDAPNFFVFRVLDELAIFQ